MKEPQTQPLLPPGKPGPELDRGGTPNALNHRDFLPPTPLDQPRTAGSSRNPILGPGSGDDDSPTPLLESPNVDLAQAGPFGEIRNPKLEPSKHSGEIRNPPLDLPDTSDYGGAVSGRTTDAPYGNPGSGPTP